MKERLVKACLVLFRNDQHITLIMEYLLGLCIADSVTVSVHIHTALGILRPVFFLGILDTS